MNLRFCFSTCVHVNNSLQKIPQSGQPRGRCARVSKSLQTPSVLNGFRNAIVRKHMKTQDFSIAKFSKNAFVWQLPLCSSMLCWCSIRVARHSTARLRMPWHSIGLLASDQVCSIMSCAALSVFQFCSL